MSQPKPTYQELKRRCHAAEAMLEAIRSGQADTIIGEQGMLVLRLAEAEKALRASEQKLRTLFELLPVGISILDQERHIVEANPAMEKILDLSHQELLAGLYMQRQYLRSDGTPLPAAEFPTTLALNKQRAVSNVEIGVVKEGGETTWAQVNAAPMTFADWRVFTTVHDITERKRAEEALLAGEARYRHTLDAMLEGCQIIGFDWRYLYLNDVADKHNRRPKEELLGQKFAQMWPGIEATEVFVFIRRCMEERLPQTMETEFTFPDGSTGWFELRIFPVPEGITILSIDITERKRTEVALRESENTVRAWLNAIQESAFIIDQEGTILAANATVARRLHHSVDEMVGACIYDFIPPQNAHERRVHVAQVIESGQSVRFEDERAGRIIDNLIYPVFDQAGQVKHLAILGTDITERRQAEAALRESEARYRLLAENMADVIWVLNTKSRRFTYVSPSVERLRGYSVAEVLTQPMEQVMTPDSLARINAGFPERLQAFLAGDPAAMTRTSEVEQTCQDGSTVWTEVVTTLLRNKAGEVEVLGVSRDISARKQAEQASRLKDELLRLTGKMAQVGGWEFDADTLEGTWTDEVARIHDLDPAQPTNVELGVSFYRAESRQKIEQAIKESLELARPYDLELEMVSAKGHHKWVRTMGLPITEGSRVVKVRGIFQDITKRKRAEDELRESRLRLELALKGANAGLWDWYVQTGQAVFNQRWAEIVGYTLEELEPVSIQTWINLCHPDDLARSDELLKQHFAGKTGFYECEARMRHKNGRWVWVLDRGQVVEWDKSGQPIRMTGTHIDITERKQADEQLRASEAKFKAVFDNAPVGISLLDAERNLLESNDMLAQVVRMGETRLIAGAYRARKYIREDGTEIPVSELASTRAIVERRAIRDVVNGIVLEDGETIWTQVSAAPLGLGDPRFVVITQDITKRKRAEESLRESEERYRKLLELAPVAIAVHSDDKLVFINPAGARLLGAASEEELIGHSVLDVIHPAGLNQVQERKTRLLAGEEGLYPVEDVYVKLDGTPINVEVTVTPLSYQGKPAFQAIVTDITERKRAEQALHWAEQRYHSLFEEAPMMYVITRNQGGIPVIADCNRSFLSALGYTTADAIDRPLADFYAPQSRAEMLEGGGYQRALAGRFAAEERQLLTREGRPVETLLKALPETDREGNVIGTRAMFVDITERKRMEESLRESEERYRKLLELAPVAITVHCEGKIVFINPAGVRLMGATSEEEAIGRSVLDIIHPAGLKQAQERLRRMMAGEQGLYPVEDIYLKLDGTPINVEVMGTPLFYQGKPAIQTIVTDITERKRAAEALRENEAFIKAILDNLPVGVAVNSVDPTVTFNYMNDNFPRFYRTTREKLADPDGFWEAIYEEPKFRAEMKQKVLADCASGDKERMMWVDVPITRQGADTHFIAAKNIPVPGKPLMISTVWDVTERKRAENELNRLNAELEQRVAERTAELSDLYHNAPCGYHSLDSNGMFVRINDTELAWLGYSREEIIGRVRFPDLLTPVSTQTFAENFPVFKERGWVQDLEFDLVRKDGSILPVLLSASAVYDQTGHFLTSRSTMMDHTERRRAEVALRESQTHLEATNKELEAFAYSVSHDLRAPLRGIDGWSLALLEDYGEQFDQTARQYLDRVRSEAQRMGHLIDDLLQLSRITRTEMHRSPVDLSALAHIVATRLQEMEPERQVEVVIQPGLTASGDAALLEIVLTNLLGNAFKFSSKCAEARIEFGCDPHASPSSPSRRGEGGEVYFMRDNGAGFDMAYAAKLFGAFQRMHKTSEFPGTGIGLATVQRIIHRHGGRIWAEAQVGQGAAFYFTLEQDPKGLRDL